MLKLLPLFPLNSTFSITNLCIVYADMCVMLYLDVIICFVNFNVVFYIMYACALYDFRALKLMLSIILHTKH